MTRLGKILVFVNVLLSFLMLGVAFGIATNRIDWSGGAGAKGGEKPAGVLDARKKRVDEANKSLALAGERWRESLAGSQGRPGLPVWEKRIADDRVWYADMLQEARVGPKDNKPQNTPVQTVKLGPDGLPVLDPQNHDRPALVAAERRRSDRPDEQARPLFCHDWYEKKEMPRLAQAIDAAHTEYQRQVKEAAELTQLAGDPARPVVDKDIRDVVAPRYGLKPGDIPLRQRIIDEQTKGARIEEEMKDVTGREKNAEVEAEILDARHGQLERRAGELKKEKK